MRSTQQVRDAWGGVPCRPRLSDFTYWTGITIPVDSRITEALQALDQTFRAWNYKPKGGQTFGYACRRIAGSSAYSLHAYGVATDVNSLTNPYTYRLVTDMPRDMVEAALAIRTKGGHLVWDWGGYWSGSKDAMHYQIVASPAELATGINWGTVRRPGGSSTTGGTVVTNRFPNSVGVKPNPGGPGFWQVATDGGVGAWGGAQFWGSMGGKPLNAPMVDLVPTADGLGYWCLGADGGIFAFGNAKPIPGYAPLADEWRAGQRAVVGGYLEDGRLWLIADTGDTYAFPLT